MVSLEYNEGKHILPKQSSEQLDSYQMPPRGNFSEICIPVYRFISPPSKNNEWCWDSSFAYDEGQTLLDSLLLARWEEFARKGLLRFDVATCAVKVVSGRREFFAQLNENLNIDFPSETRSVTDLQPTSFEFSYMNVCCEDILFCLSSGDQNKPVLIPSAAVPKNSILIIINKNPIEHGHVFLVPCNLHSPVPFLDLFNRMVQVAAEINNCSCYIFCDQPVFSNSDNTCFQACYFSDQLPVEHMLAISIFSERGVNIFEIADYPIKALEFATKANSKLMVKIVSEMCSYLNDRNTPFGLLISNCGQKVFLFLQSDTLASSLSAWECGGYFVYNEQQKFDEATEEGIMEQMAAVSLDQEDFQAVKQVCCDVANKLVSLGQ